MVAAVCRPILAQPDADTVAATGDQVRDQRGGRFPTIAGLIAGLRDDAMDDAMDEATAEVLAFSRGPGVHELPAPTG